MSMLHKISILKQSTPTPSPPPHLVLYLFLLVVPFFKIIVEAFVILRCGWGGKLDFGIDYEIR
jgi:hypothetical protein